MTVLKAPTISITIPELFRAEQNPLKGQVPYIGAADVVIDATITVDGQVYKVNKIISGKMIKPYTKTFDLKDYKL